MAVGIGRNEAHYEADTIVVGGVRRSAMDHLAVMIRHFTGLQFPILGSGVVDLVIGDVLEGNQVVRPGCRVALGVSLPEIVIAVQFSDRPFYLRTWKDSHAAGHARTRRECKPRTDSLIGRKLVIRQILVPTDVLSFAGLFDDEIRCPDQDVGSNSSFNGIEYSVIVNNLIEPC